MDQQNEAFYKNLVFATPYLVAGFFISLIFNYYTLAAGANNSAFRFYGWPFKSGEIVAGELNLHIIGYSANVVVWTFILGIVVAILVKIFGNKNQ
jgi:hypothetical protein